MRINPIPPVHEKVVQDHRGGVNKPEWENDNQTDCLKNPREDGFHGWSLLSGIPLCCKFIICILGTFISTNAATYYVRTDGNDANTGTANTSGGAWLTINHATATAVAGDTINVGPGNFPEEVRCADHAGSSGSPVTIQAITPGATMVGSFTWEEPYINIYNFYVTNKSAFNGMLYVAQNGSHCILSNNVFDANFNAAITPIVKWNGADAQPFGTAGSFNTIVSNTFRNIRSEMVFRVFGDTNLITGNFLANLDFADCIQYFGRGHTFSYNTCSNLFFSGRNENHADCDQTFGSAGGSSYGSKDHLFEGNIYIGGPSLTNSESLWQVGNYTDDGNPEVKNITHRNNVYIGIAAKASITIPGMLWYNNLFVRCATNTQNGGAVLVFNVNAVGDATGGRAYNNIAIDCGLAGATNTGLTYFWPTLVDVKSDYNAVYKTVNGRLAAIQIDPSHRAVGDVGGWDTTDWWEPNGINGPVKNVGGVSSTIAADPQFINPSQMDFRLLANSPLRGVSQDLSAQFTTDIRGATRSAWDIGPYAFQQSDFNTYPIDVGPRLIQAYSTVASNATTIHWPANTNRIELKIDRRSFTNRPSAWGVFTNIYSLSDATVTNSGAFTDTNIAGVHYEYRIQQQIATNSIAGYGDPNGYRDYQHLDTGYHVPLKDVRGSVCLLVESGITNAIWTELTTLQSDLRGAGYKVYPHYVAAVDVTAGVTWTNAVWVTRQLVATDYNIDTNTPLSVFIVGHVPVPYAGDISPGSHADNIGAHAADLFYADLNGPWTDTDVTDTSADAPWTHNIPGDGKLDQTYIPSMPEVRIGRLDLRNMPAFSKSETQLIQQYLQRDHAWRHKQFTVSQRGLDYSDSNTNLIVAAKPLEIHNLYASYFGTPGTSEVLGNWLASSHDSSNPFLFAAKYGSGHTNEDVQLGTTADFAATNFYAVFVSSFGSYYGSWDSAMSPDIFLQAVLANGGYPLTTSYRENFMLVNAAAMDEPIGYEEFAMQSGRFFLGTGKEYIFYDRIVPFGSTNSITDQHKNYESLMGDPTLLTHQVAPPSGMAVNVSGSDNVVTFTASTDTGVVGCHLYRAPSSDPNSFTRLTSVPTSSPITDIGAAGGDYTYMLRTVKLDEDSPARSFYSASQGIFATASGDGGGGGSSSSSVTLGGNVTIGGNVQIQ